MVDSAYLFLSLCITVQCSSITYCVVACMRRLAGILCFCMSRRDVFYQRQCWNPRTAAFVSWRNPLVHLHFTQNAPHSPIPPFIIQKEDIITVNIPQMRTNLKRVVEGVCLFDQTATIAQPADFASVVFLSISILLTSRRCQSLYVGTYVIFASVQHIRSNYFSIK